MVYDQNIILLFIPIIKYLINIVLISLQDYNIYIPGDCLCVFCFNNLDLDFFSNLNPYLTQQRAMSAEYCLYISELKHFFKNIISTIIIHLSSSTVRYFYCIRFRTQANKSIYTIRVVDKDGSREYSPPPPGKFTLTLI